MYATKQREAQNPEQLWSIDVQEHSGGGSRRRGRAQQQPPHGGSSAEVRKLKNRQHAANSRQKKAEHMQSLCACADALAREVRELQEHCARESERQQQQQQQQQQQPEPQFAADSNDAMKPELGQAVAAVVTADASSSRPRIVSLSLSCDGDDNDSGLEAAAELDLENLDSLWEDIDGMTMAAAAAGDAAVTGNAVAGPLDGLLFCDVAADAKSNRATSLALPVQSVGSPALGRLVSLSDFEFPTAPVVVDAAIAADGAEGDGDVLGGGGFGLCDTFSPKVRRPSSCSTSSTASTGSLTTTASLDDVGGGGRQHQQQGQEPPRDHQRRHPDSDDSSGSSGSGGSGRKPKKEVPPVAHGLAAGAAVQRRLELYLDAEAWEEMKEQLKVCEAEGTAGPATAVAQWKRRRSKGMKLARNRRYGSRRRARERGEAKALERHVRKLESEKAALLTRLRAFEQSKEQQQQQHSESAGRAGAGAVSSPQKRQQQPLKRRAPPMTELLTDAAVAVCRMDSFSSVGSLGGGGVGGDGSTKRMTFASPRMMMMERFAALPPCDDDRSSNDGNGDRGIVDVEDLPPSRRRQRRSAPPEQHTAATTAAAQWQPQSDGGAVFGGTAFRLFAVVAVAILATSLDAGADDIVDGAAGAAAGVGGAHVGHVLSACYLLNTRPIVALIEAFPLMALTLAVACSGALAVALTLAAGSRERQDNALKWQVEQRHRQQRGTREQHAGTATVAELWSVPRGHHHHHCHPLHHAAVVH